MALYTFHIMDSIATLYGGECIQSGGGVYIAVIPLSGGQCMVIGEDSIAIYNSRAEFDDGENAIANYFISFITG